MKTYLLLLFSLLTMPCFMWSPVLQPDSGGSQNTQFLTYSLLGVSQNPTVGFNKPTPQQTKQSMSTIVTRATSVPFKTARTDSTAGEAVYKQYCLSCHQANGSGVPKLNPPLKGTDWVLGDKTRLINVILKGLQNVDIEDEPYDNVMPAHEFLTDPQIADVLTYVRSHFGNRAGAITPDEVKTARATTGK